MTYNVLMGTLNPLSHPVRPILINLPKSGRIRRFSLTLRAIIKLSILCCNVSVVMTVLLLLAVTIR